MKHYTCREETIEKTEKTNTEKTNRRAPYDNEKDKQQQTTKQNKQTNKQTNKQKTEQSKTAATTTTKRDVWNKAGLYQSINSFLWHLFPEAFVRTCRTRVNRGPQNMLLLLT